MGVKGSLVGMEAHVLWPVTLLMDSSVNVHRVLRAQPASMTLTPVAASTAKMVVLVSPVKKALNVCAPPPSMVPSANIPQKDIVQITPATMGAPASTSQKPRTTTAFAPPASMAYSATSWITASQAAQGETSRPLLR